MFLILKKNLKLIFIKFNIYKSDKAFNNLNFKFTLILNEKLCK